jgi:hypothetical protein
MVMVSCYQAVGCRFVDLSRWKRKFGLCFSQQVLTHGHKPNKYGPFYIVALAWAACSVTIVGFFKAGVRQHGAAVSTGATLD